MSENNITKGRRFNKLRSLAEESICLECFGAEKVEITPGVFEDCTTCHESVALNIRPVQAKLRKKFRLWCMEKEITMVDAIIIMMSLAIENDLDLTKKRG